MGLAPRLLTPPHHTAFGGGRQRAAGGARPSAPGLVARLGLRLALALLAVDLRTELGRLALQNLVPFLGMRLCHVLQRLAIPPDLLALRHRWVPHFMPTAFRRFASRP